MANQKLPLIFLACVALNVVTFFTVCDIFMTLGTLALTHPDVEIRRFLVNNDDNDRTDYFTPYVYACGVITLMTSLESELPTKL